MVLKFVRWENGRKGCDDSRDVMKRHQCKILCQCGCLRAMPVCLSACLLLCLSVCPSVSLSFCLSVCCPSICLSFCVCLPVCLSAG
jgi:hypothetical protein